MAAAVSILKPKTRTRKEWAAVISARWEKATGLAKQSVEEAIQTGVDLLQSKAELSHGDFTEMIERDLPFGSDKAARLIKIARNPELVNTATSRNLPVVWTALYELARLSKEDFKDAQKRGLIDSKTTYKTAHAIAGAYETPVGKAWGKGHSPLHLPTAADASKIARATGRLVAAADGNVYSGSTEEEGAEYVRRRQQTYGVIDAVKVLADCAVTPDKWINQTEDHWLLAFRLGSVDAAIKWLTDLRPVLAKKQGVVDAE